MSNLSNTFKPNRQLSNLGLANKAGKVVCGDDLLKALKSNQVYLLFIATDASEKTKERFTKSAQFKQIPVINDYSCVELSTAIGKVNRMVLGITEQGFLKILI